MRRRLRQTLLLSFCVMFLGVLLACSRNAANNGANNAAGGGDAGSGAATAPNTAPGAPGPSPAKPSDLEVVMPLEAQTVFERSCKTCHGPDGHGIAAVAPDLRAAGRRTADEWVKYLRDPNSVHPNSRMPAIESLTDEDYQAVATYLADLTQHNAPPVNQAACLHSEPAAKKDWLSGAKHIWQIVRDVLRGYLLGQPPDEPKPRKGCC
jgi:mono/diheme cytochrome c family protein